MSLGESAGLGVSAGASGGGKPGAPSPGHGGSGRQDRLKEGQLGARALGKMSALLEQKEEQERLQEAAALRDIQEVQKLVESGMDVNSQNEIKGWTCSHRACKCNHGQVISYLLYSGADREILTTKGEMPVQLTSSREIRKTVGVEEDGDDDEIPKLKKESELPFDLNYLANPAFPLIYTPAAEDSTQLQNGGPSPPPMPAPCRWLTSIASPTEPPLLGAFPREPHLFGTGPECCYFWPLCHT